jgi:plasmid stabilization system protein ParE
MAYEVVWTFHAEEDYRQIILYLKNEWTESVALNFIELTEERIDRIAVFPLLGIASEKDNSIRSIVLTKHNKLYYQFLHSKIFILSIFDTRQHPDKNKFI